MKQSFFHHPTRIVKILGIMCFISIIIVEISVFLSPQQGYELSFYSSTPSFVFILLCICIICGIFILVHQAYYEFYKVTKFWLLGFFTLLFVRVLILYLPYIRNYYTWMGDNSTHFGVVREIVLTGRIFQGNFYPIVHTYLAQIQIFSSIPLELVVNHSTALLSVLFVLSIYLLANSVFNFEKPVILALAAVGCVIFSSYDLFLMPNGWSCLYFPLVVYLILKAMTSTKGFSFKILAIIAMIFYPFFHPLSTILLILLLILIIALNISFRYFTKNSQISSIIKGPFFNNSPWILLCIISAVWIPWLSSFYIFNNNLKFLYDSITTGNTFIVIGGMIASFEKMNLNLFDFFTLLIKIYGDELIFLLLFIIGIIIFLKYYKTFRNTHSIIILAIITLFFGTIYLFYLFSIIPGLGSIGAQRMITYIVLFLPVFAGITYSFALSQRKTIITFICILLIILPPVLTLFAFIPSPYIINPTPEITRMDIAGMRWSIDHKNPDISYVFIMSPPERFADIIIGPTNQKAQGDIFKNSIKIPDHFNYYSNPFFGQIYNNDKYAVLTYFDLILYETVYKPVGRFLKVDFFRLQIDSTVNRIYSNGECTEYFIHGQL